ncbi:MAG: UbiX family flavin prenyltransferase [Chloroflexi bacterium]|nr:UbiX family flavin prenyltransferase [Chloroflexota bacterium]
MLLSQDQDAVETFSSYATQKPFINCICLGRTIEGLQDLDRRTHGDPLEGLPIFTISIASGSFHTDGMVVVPCSIKTLSGIANSFNDNLLVRAADVTLKERRRLVLVVRETPLHVGHLRLMTQAAEIGAIITPPMPAFYHKPKTIDDIVNQTVGRVLDLLGVAHPDLFRRWNGPEARH